MTVEDRGGAAVRAPEPVDALVEEFRGFLGGERGLASETVRCYGNHARAFLAWLPQPVDVALAELSAGLVTGYVVEYCRGRNTESAKAMVTALRSLLRFLHVTGRAPGSLVGAVPAVANWRLAGLPRTLSAGQVEALIDGCDTDTAVGARDRALLVMLARLGPAHRRGGCRAAGGRGLAVRADPDQGQGQPGRAAPAAAGGGRGTGRVRDQDASAMCVAVGVPDRAGSSTTAADRDGGPADRRPGVRAGRAAPAGRAPAAAHPGQRPAARRELAAADRPGAAPPQPAVHRDLRQGRHRPASRTWPGPGRDGADRHDGPDEPHRPDRRDVPRRARVAGWVAAGGPGVPGHPTGAGVRAVDAGPVADGLRRLL